jgi:hypothetical protein
MGHDLGTTPTVEWPNSVQDLINAVQNETVPTESYQQFMSKYLPGMLAASSGSIGLFPDYFGYGESNNMNRALYWPRMHEQTTVVSYLKLQRYIASLTGGCTLLDDAVTIRGVEEGAAVAIVASDSLRRFGSESLTVFAGAGPLDTETLLYDTIQAYEDDNATPQLDLILAFMAFSFSAEIAGMNNTGFAQPLAADEYSAAVASTDPDQVLLNWFAAPDPPSSSVVASRVPINSTDIVRQSVRELFVQARASGESSPCRTLASGAENGKLCEAIVEASSWRLLEGETRDVIYPYQLCFGRNDEIFTSNHYPSRIFANSLVNFYRGPIGFPDLAPAGDHDRVRQLCSLDPILFFNLEGHAPQAEENRPNYRTPLSAVEMLVCESGPSGSTMAPMLSQPTDSPYPTSEPIAASSIEPTRILTPRIGVLVLVAFLCGGELI